jgi:Do/DeqQ family serine protease
LKKLWLVFAQTATVALALLFVVSTLRPEWLPGGAPQASRELMHEPARDLALRPAAPEPVALAAAGRADSYAEAVRRAVPAVVNIYTTKEITMQQHPFMNDPVFRQFFGDGAAEPQKAQGLGSGVIVSEKGYILTNEHVVDAADEIQVALTNGKRYKARVVGADPDTDLAVLQVDAGTLPSISFGNDASLRLGDVVLAIGNPFGVGQTVTMGIVSGLGRTPGINTFENFIQTDAAINPGNSGGALVDALGNLVGINTAIYSRTGGNMGIGFAIPVSSARQVLESIIKSGSVTRGWIGVEPQEITPELAESFKIDPDAGVLVAGVVRGGPADRAGVRPGDVLLSLSGASVHDPSAMRNMVAGFAPGRTITAGINREHKSIELKLEVGKRPKAGERS